MGGRFFPLNLSWVQVSGCWVSCFCPTSDSQSDSLSLTQCPTGKPQLILLSLPRQELNTRLFPRQEQGCRAKLFCLLSFMHPFQKEKKLLLVFSGYSFFFLLQAASPIFAVKLVWRSKRSTKVGKGEKNVVMKKPKALPTKPKLTKKATTVGKPTQAPLKTKARLPPKKPKKPVKSEKPVLRMYMYL